MTMKKRRKKKNDTKKIIKTLEGKLGELLQLREDLEVQEESVLDKNEKKELIQQLIDVNHQIQALRVVIGMYSRDLDKQRDL